MEKRLIVIVSTQEALRVALSSDLDALCIYHTLQREMGTSLMAVMETAGFYPEKTESSRGIIFVRKK